MASNQHIYVPNYVFFIVDSTDPSLGETLLEDIKKFLQTEDEASEEIHTKSKYDDESESSTIINYVSYKEDLLSVKIQDLKESLAHQVLEENSNHNIFGKVRAPRLHEDYNSTLYNQTDQFDTSNLLAGTEIDKDVNYQTTLMRLRISG